MPRQNMGPGGRGVEKSKDFGGSMKRLLINLNPWKFLLYLSLILAMISAILSLIAPKKLSSLTDTITSGIRPNMEVLEEISMKMFSNFSSDVINGKISIIMGDSSISDSDKIIFQDTMKEISLLEDNGEAINLMLSLPENILIMLLEDIVINQVEVDGIILSDVVIDVDTQMEMLDVFKKMNNTDEMEVNLAMLEELPEDVYSYIEPQIDMDRVFSIGLFMAILYVVSAIFNFVQNFSMTTISNRFANNLRTNISNKINVLPLKYFDSHEAGDVLSRVTNDVDMIAHNLNQSLVTLVTSITLFLGSIIMMFYTNAIMAITAIIASLVGFSVMFLLLGKSQKYFVKKQTELGNLNGYIEEMYSGHNVVKAYNGTKEAILKFGKLNYELYDANRKSQFLSGLMHPIMGFVGNLGYVCVCIVGALLVNNSSITFGVIVAFMIYVRLFTNPLTQIAQAMTNLQSVVAASERVFEFLDEEEMSSQEGLTTVLKKEKVKGRIEFKNVKFGYDKDKTIIKDFTAVAEPGQKIAIVGPTGAGKTTMVNLLMKFYEINDGDIKIDGISTKKLTRENIHSLFTMVLQDTWLFNGTVKENIVYNRQDVSLDRVKEVCEVVGVDHFIKTLPNGYDSILSDNDSVSAGQRQLITIARGMIEDAPFLILDEATSNVDTRTEELVQKAMDKLMEGRTSFIIAHRLSTIKNADLILVMKDGNIIEQGNHDELILKNGFYAELYNSQFQN